MSTQVLVQAIDGEARVSSEIIAERTEVQHKNVVGYVRDNLADFEAFGTIAFETRKSGGRPTEVAHLNEQQATLLMTFMRNSPVVKAFKIELVRQFFEMRKALAGPAVQEIGRRELAQMIIEAEDRSAALAAKVNADAPKVEYVEKHVIEDSDLITIANFASQFNSTEPTVRALMHEKGIAARKLIEYRWSKSKREKVPEYEWRASQGKRTSDWFVLRAQHNAPRLHNGQVRQTMYVKQFYVDQLAQKLGLTVNQIDFEGSVS